MIKGNSKYNEEHYIFTVLLIFYDWVVRHKVRSYMTLSNVHLAYNRRSCQQYAVKLSRFLLLQ